MKLITSKIYGIFKFEVGGNTEFFNIFFAICIISLEYKRFENLVIS